MSNDIILNRELMVESTTRDLDVRSVVLYNLHDVCLAVILDRSIVRYHYLSNTPQQVFLYNTIQMGYCLYMYIIYLASKEKSTKHMSKMFDT